jgi:hypothetical protein
MDLVERVENTRFLGREFLVWLWFKSELHEAEFSRPDGSPFELWLDSQLGMRFMYEPTERIAFKGVAPAARVEAKLALQRGWLPVKARICVTLDTKDFSFVFEADALAKTAVKLPMLTESDSDERFFERMHLLELLDELLNEQYSEFLQLRRSVVWDPELAPAIVAWTRGEPTLSEKAYRGMVQRSAKG